VVTVPLMLLAIPSVLIGLWAIGPMLFGDYFKGVIAVSDSHPAMKAIAGHFHGWFAMATHAVVTLPFWLAAAGVAFAWYCYLVNPGLPAAIARSASGIHRLLEQKYYLDRFNDFFFAGGARLIGRGLWKAGDQGLIDGIAINGSARLVGWIASLVRTVQSGFIYHYAFAMIFGVAVLLWWFVPLIKR
jgi:NADH-quinone oxidoreductase subunit L